MTWEWRGETFAATSAEYFSIKNQLESERFAPETVGGPPRYYGQLPHEERAKLLKERLKKYCQRVWLHFQSTQFPCVVEQAIHEEQVCTSRSPRSGHEDLNT